MADERQIAFGSFRFGPRTGQLWHEDSEVRLTPRAAAVLQTLIERAQEIVTKQDLFDRVWGGLAVTDDALTSCIGELREALGDDARRPRYIETRHRRGFRLMMPITPAADKTGATPAPEIAASPSTRLVGREAELDELMRRFEAASSGKRQIVFVTGEPGIGKSALVDAFLARIQASHAVRIAHGQCLDHHGIGEPYLPLVEAFTRLAHGRDGARMKEVLSRQAPSWFAQMPSLWTGADRSLLGARGRATRERMVRELTLAVEAIALDVPLPIQVEDLQWSDASTLDWLAHMARSRAAAPILVLATSRRPDVTGAKIGLDALVNELAVHGLCSEIELHPLERDAVENYLALRLGNSSGALELKRIAGPLFERTGGNPLFMVSLVNELTRHGMAGAALDPIVSIPRDIRRFIERQIDELTEADRDLLMAASVIAREFATTAVAAILDSEIEMVEAGCGRLARQGVFLAKTDSVVWPEGTRTELYSFRHDLYRELLYDRLPSTRRATSHGRIGRRLEQAWKGRLDEIAAVLAEHFERANEPVSAIPHHHRAAAKALRRSANAVAINHLQRALNAIPSITDELERTKIEVELLVNLGAAFVATRGFGAPEVLEAYSRAEALCDLLGERADIFPALWGQWLFRWGRSEIDAAWRLCERLLALAARSDDSGLKLQAHHASWATSFGLGRLADVRAHAEAGLALYDAKIHQPMASSYGNHDAGTCARYFAALSLALSSESDRGRAMAETAVAIAHRLNDPFSLALAHYVAAVTAQILGDTTLSAQHAEAAFRIATEHDLAMPRAWSTGVIGWCAAENGDPVRGTALLTEAVAALHSAHSRHFMPYLLGLLAQVQMTHSSIEDAVKTIEEGLALAEAGGERFYSAELHRLHGEYFSRLPRHKKDAEESFRAAIALAKQQGAKLLERRARESLQSWSA